MISLLSLCAEKRYVAATCSPRCRTQTIDYGIVLSGEIHLVLDDQEVHLRAGDIVVQRGTIHAWSNRSNAVCRMAFVLVDGRYGDDILG
jgi:uncharacterized cupin superfamily protein